MIRLAWSVLERVLPRAASALIMLVLAARLAPSVVGIYAWMVLALTLVQTIGDTAARQTAVVHAGTASGALFIGRFRVWSAVIGGALLAVVVVALLLTQAAQDRWQVLALAPFVFVPAASAAGIDALVRLQRSARWKDIASNQAWSSTCSLLCSVPTLLVTESLLASALQALLAEAGFAILNRRRAARLERPADTGTRRPELTGGVFRDYLHTALFSLLGWGQGQTDRLSIGALAGGARLGQYSFAMSLSRSIGDAAALAAINVLRPVLAEAARDGRGSEIVAVTEASLRRSLALTVVAAVATTIGVHLFVAPFLADDWNPALALVPVLALSVAPSVVAWSVTAVLQAESRMRWASPIKAVGVLLSLPVGVVALTDLQLAAWLVNARELIVMALLLLAARHRAPWRGGLLALCVVLVGAAVWYLTRG
ncbi:Membrane protein involved in the export of O-antigen and teichoic acid [Plantibacter flavus]|uniref:O-antigen/teichoic acid export membrane protein n=1 Tax=Plantibacter flavus TaxID=150123 RepID=A0A3N2C4I3_9MICO|nr:oligosaccharide flippase family protein [Plantibacter flavus]ROR82425.1 O-antigen/teichoic acid export membrane protein [Plantibacter flavus]SMG44084.1 Membrane protein involved in the export of O-antigen and teichoic acid [Plantibacter flavus]